MASSADVVKKVEAEINPLVQQIEQMEIKDNDQYVAAGDILTTIKKREKDIKARKEEITKPLNAALKSARDLFKPVETHLADSKTSLLTKMGTFKREQDRIAAEKAAKLQAKIEKGTIKNPETIMRNVDKIERADDRAAGIVETTRKVVDIDLQALEIDYLKELLNRPTVRASIETEIRKDALGNKTQGIAPRIEKGVNVREEKSIY